ncbi:hypothetical protein [Bordetella sp. N]|uniref:hypothetical protein n=1 Tax=Bordetella sp. N TaxID=1746199 RepID=UPI00070B85B4|nr:hypothetical protein [Bordetella sp. N]ALM84194.1 hypothetical protein ASB57_15520 [Bordetella sp. N]
MSKLNDTLHGLAVELGAESPVADARQPLKGGATAAPAARPHTPIPPDEPWERDQAAAPAVLDSGAAWEQGAAPEQDPALEQGAVGQEFAISTSAGRIYIQDESAKVIDIGDLEESNRVYAYRLDHGDIVGQDLPDLGAALRHLAAHLTPTYLDPLFRTQPDVADEASLHSVSVPAIRVRLAP